MAKRGLFGPGPTLTINGKPQYTDPYTAPAGQRAEIVRGRADRAPGMA